MEFPQYRKYKNGLSYFKITSKEYFEEYKLVGNKLEYYQIKAKILPDRNYIQDMLLNYESFWEKIGKQEFSAFIERY